METMTERPGVNHALHIVLTLLTLGFWLPVYAVILIAQSARTKRAYREAAPVRPDR